MNHHDTIDAIIELWRQREDMIKARLKLTLQAQAMLRRLYDGDKDLAGKAFMAIKKNPAHQHAAYIMPLMMGMEPLLEQQAMLEKSLVKHVKTLPIYGWAQGIKGLGDISLAGLVGEIKDVGSYKSVSAVWKRMGLAVMGDTRQGAPGKGATADDWIAHGYSKTRRSLIWNIGECVIKAQWRGAKAATEDEEALDARPIGPYGEYYGREKAKQLAKGLTPAHANNRAKRHMTKEVLKHFYLQWRALAEAEDLPLAA